MLVFVDALILLTSQVREMRKSKNQPEVRTVTKIAKRKKQTIPISIKREIQSLSAQGFKYREIMKKLNLSHFPKQTFSDIKKKNFDNQVNSRSYNSSYKTTDLEIVKEFENQAVQLYKRKNRSGSFPSE